MSVDEGFEKCRVCGHMYRPSVIGSVEGHERAAGHPPVPDGPPPTPAAGERVSPAELLHTAARRLKELQDVVDGLEPLVASWEHHGAPKDPAAVLRAYLARPPVYAQPTVGPDDPPVADDFAPAPWDQEEPL